MKNKVKSLEHLNFIPQRFLVISHTALGDTIMATPAIKSLKLSFPNSKIFFVIHHKFYPLFKHFHYIDKIFLYKKSFFSLLLLPQKLKKEKIEVAIILHGNSPQDIWIAIMSGAEFILKHKIEEGYKDFLSHKDVLLDGHMIDKKLYLLKLLKAKTIIKEMEINLPENPQIENKIKKFFPTQRSIIFGFQLGASHLKRTWPIENFVSLAIKLTRKYKDCFFVLLGNYKEKNLGKIFIKMYPFKNYVNLTGKLSIEELAYAIKQLNILITPDTGPLHLAIALKVPTISLFALSYPQYTGPLQDLHMHKVIFKPEGLKYRNKETNEGMRLITVDDVLEKIEECFKNGILQI